MNAKTEHTQRRYDLDWLRVLVILTVFIYHSARFFNLDVWHVKNATTYLGVEIWEQVLATWMMPLCFVISGASVFYALGKGRPGTFVKDKVLRLLVPLLVGMFTHSALQVYLERLTQGGFSGSFFEFYPHYFEGLYPFDGGNFAWMGIHLWYLEMLFVFSLVFLPVFLWLKRGSGQRILAGLGNLLAVPGAIYLLVVPVVLVVNLVDPESLWGTDVWAGWSLLAHACFFLTGFVIASNERLQQSIQRLRWLWLIGAVALPIAQIVAWVISSNALAGTPRYGFDLQYTEFIAYFWILALLGLGSKHLSFNTPSLRHANEAVLPFYILHQPVLLCAGYLVVQWAMPDLAKYIIIAASSFAIIVGLYEFLVRRIDLLRLLFGMKLLPKAPVAQPRRAVEGIERPI